jgi:sulfate adenylyltransferase subunit 1 (EFTu-like GTPase family)
MAGFPNNQAVIKERREKALVLLTRGIGRCEIAKADILKLMEYRKNANFGSFISKKRYTMANQGS